MNGIITFDDGSGTVIEDGAIQTDSFSTTNFQATNLSATNVQTNTLTATGNLNALSVTTDTILATTAVGSRIVDIFDNLGVNDTINIGSDCATKLAGAVVIESAESNFYASSMVVTPTSVKTNNLQGKASSDTIDLFNNITTGTVRMCNNLLLKSGSILSNTVSTTISLFNTSTGEINFGGSGTLNICDAQTTAGVINIGQNKTSGWVLLGNASIPTIIKGQLNCEGDIKLSTGKSIFSSAVTDTINVFNNITTGSVNLATSLTSGTLYLGGSGHVRVGNVFTFDSENITSSGIADTINVFNNITTGTANLCTGLSTGTLYLGGIGNIRVGNVFTFKNENITSSGIADTINVFNNITTGTINLCNGLTSTGSVNFGGAGTVKMGKVRIGLNGTPYRYMIMENAIGAGISGSYVYSIPGAPTGMGTPLIIVTINVTIANSVNMYVVNAIALNDTQFRYRKRFWNGAVLSDASTESINYVAYWL